MKTWRPRLADALIALAMFTLAVTSSLALSEIYEGPAKTLDAVGVLIIAFVTLPLAWRHAAPRLVLWLCTLAWMLFVGLGYLESSAIFGLVIAIYSAALYLPRRSALWHAGSAVAVILGWTLVGVAMSHDVSLLTFVQLGIVLSVPFGIGIADSRRAARLTELELDQQRREQAQRIAAADAVRAERARIARELHDVVAHEITVMTLHAEGARRRAGEADGELAEALTTIADSGRKGLAEMQRVIGVLRASEQEAEDEVAELTGHEPRESRPAVDYEPVPSLAALPRLTQQVADAGLPVDLEVMGSAHVPASVELTAYRIVQEALTNAMKYAGPGASARVRVTRTADTVAVLVEDDGRGVISEAAQGSGGHGIDGMRERVAAIGGSIDVGARKGGGFRVQAWLPVTDDQVRGRGARAVKGVRS
jgi:signal transduction histidine kinase